MGLLTRGMSKAYTQRHEPAQRACVQAVSSPAMLPYAVHSRRRPQENRVQIIICFDILELALVGIDSTDWTRGRVK